MQGKMIIGVPSSNKKQIEIQMKKFIFLLALVATTVQAQRSVRIGYIDMEYILQNTPNYIDAKNQLEQKAQKWKQEIEVKKIEISKLRESLMSEKVLLTKELIEERESEIKQKETELAEFQEKKFGPLGELITQKTLLVQPVQDQVFNIVQDIAEAKKYDFIFDRSSDLTMLFADKRYDVSELVVRKLNNATKAEQRTKKQQKADEAKEKAQDLLDENPALAEKAKAEAKSKEARQKAIEDKRLATVAAAELRKKEAEDRRQKALDDRAAKKTGTISVSDKPADGATTNNIVSDKVKVAEEARLAREKAIEERRLAKEKEVEDRRKALEEKKAKALAEREAAAKAKEEAKIKK
jgi:Skp family chaperone for outer membrane proteins